MKSRVTVKWLMTHYTKREVMIPMRDGVRLYTALYEPKEGDAHPVIMERSPYGFHPYGKTFPEICAAGWMRSWKPVISLSSRMSAVHT